VLENLDESGCEDVLTAVVYGETPAGVPSSVEFAMAELGWWLNGSCADASDAANGRCAVNATCNDVKTPSGAWGHRCACSDGVSGDGFAGAEAEGCHYREFVRRHLLLCVFLFLVGRQELTVQWMIWGIKVTFRRRLATIYRPY
jgi:hypothetical protein